MNITKKIGIHFGWTWLFLVVISTIFGCSGSGHKDSGGSTNATVPGAPTIGDAAGGNGQATISFAAPATTGDSPITGYIVTSDPEGKTATGTGSPIIVTGLTNGTAYVFTVQAINAVGTGPASAASNSVTPMVSVSGSNKIPDTGQTLSYTNTFGEDSDYTINPPSYTKLDANGNSLPDSAISWVTVKDNVTGLIWENKTDDGGIHDMNNRYTWYDSNPATNGGNAGTAGNGTDTTDFIAALNSANFGGFNDWRLPTIMELSMLVYAGQLSLAINSIYFPYTMASYYWSATPSAGDPTSAWSVLFSSGTVGYYVKSDSLYVRAVRGGL